MVCQFGRPLHRRGSFETAEAAHTEERPLSGQIEKFARG